MYEVELKFPLSNSTAIRAKLAECGAVPRAREVHSDSYYNHPCRDFRQTDEALRIRSIGENNFLTYKGPLLDPHTKTRRELESPLAAGADATAQWVQTLEALGFRFVMTVRKTREKFDLSADGRQFEIALDDVAGLGSYVEIETIADDASRPAAQQAVLALAAKFGLEQPERRGYLTMLLAK